MGGVSSKKIDMVFAATTDLDVTVQGLNGKIGTIADTGTVDGVCNLARHVMSNKSSPCRVYDATNNILLNTGSALPAGGTVVVSFATLADTTKADIEKLVGDALGI